MDPHAKGARFVRLLAVACAITCVIAIVNLFASTNKPLWGSVAAASGIIALLTARSFAVFHRREF